MILKSVGSVFLLKPEASYTGKVSGHFVDVGIGSMIVTFEIEPGVRGYNIPVTVKVDKDGYATATTKEG
jgi:hypothetical protein